LFLYSVRLLEELTERGLYKSEERYEVRDTVIIPHKGKECTGEILCCLGEVEEGVAENLKMIIRKASTEEESSAKTRNIRRKEIFDTVKNV